MNRDRMFSVYLFAIVLGVIASLEVWRWVERKDMLMPMAIMPGGSFERATQQLIEMEANLRDDIEYNRKHIVKVRHEVDDLKDWTNVTDRNSYIIQRLHNQLMELKGVTEDTAKK